MDAARYQDVIDVLQSSGGLKCDARVSLLLAGALEGTGDLRKAEETLERAHVAWPSNTSIAASLAREYLAGGDVDKAVGALKEFHVTTATPPQEMEEGVVVYLAGHRLVPAQAVAEVAYKSNPSLHFLLLLANVLQLEGRYKDVNLLLGGKRKEYGSSPEFLITAAESEYDAMLYDAARADLEGAIALNRDSYQAHYLLGNVLVAQGDASQAAAEYQAAIRLAPDKPRTYYQLALISRAKQDDAGEEQLLEQALAVDPHYAPANCEMGRIRIGQHRLAEAVDRLNLAVEYNPQIEQAYYLLARAYAGLGEKEKSDDMVKRYTTIRAANRRSSVDQHKGQLGAEETAAP
jgi:protein O-GlcNAc transferase